MSVLATPLLPPGRRPLIARLNPVAKLGAALVLMIGLVSTIDAVTPTVLLLLEFAVIVLSGISVPTLLRRSWPLAIGITGLMSSTLLFTENRSGALLFQLGEFDLTSGRLLSAVAIGLRVLAIALPGILAFATTDPTDFADSLVAQLRAPARFTFGALAAFRLFPLLGDEWRTLLLARRARGVEAGRNPVRRLRLLTSGVFGLLVAAIRRGVRLATAMDARGFGAAERRTQARPARFGPADWLCVLGAIVAVALATGISVAVGAWHFLLWETG